MLQPQRQVVGRQHVADVGGAVGHNLGHVGLEPEKDPGEGQPPCGKDQEGAQGQEDARVGGLVGLGLLLGPQLPLWFQVFPQILWSLR